MFFRRHPLEKVWTRFQKYERAISPMNYIDSRSAKRITAALRYSLKKEIDRRRRLGTCSVQGIYQIVDHFNKEMSGFEFSVERPGPYTDRQQRKYRKAIIAARDLSEAVENLARVVVRGSSDPRNKYMLPRVESPKFHRLLLALRIQDHPDSSSDPVDPDAALDEWWQQVAPHIDELPIFGQDVTPVPRQQRKRKRGQALELQDRQRLLLSCLAGGSASQKAQRIGVSRRTVYTWLRKIIYTPNPDKLLEDWFSLGLIAVLEVPICPGSISTQWPQVVCLICHHLLGPYPRERRDTLPFQVVKADPQRQLRPAELWTAATEIQGHLILHFEVGDPVLNHFGESNWSRIPSDTQKSFDYWAELGESGIAPGGDPTPSNLLDWENWRKKVLAGKKIPSPQATVLNSDHRFHATPGSEERRW